MRERILINVYFPITSTTESLTEVVLRGETQHCHEPRTAQQRTMNGDKRIERTLPVVRGLFRDAPESLLMSRLADRSEGTLSRVKLTGVVISRGYNEQRPYGSPLPVNNRGP